MKNRCDVEAPHVSKWKNFMEYIALKKQERINLSDMALK